jgi:hypothetical protein
MVIWAVEPAEWVEVDWASSPDLPVTAIRVDGATFYGHDHYCVTDRYVAVWSDDPRDNYEPGIVRVWDRSTRRSHIEILPPVGPTRHGLRLLMPEWERIRDDLIADGCACRDD